MERLSIVWTPNEVLVQRIVDDQVVGTSTYDSIQAALAGVKILLERQERAWMFPARTDDAIDAEVLAQAIEERLGKI